VRRTAESIEEAKEARQKPLTAEKSSKKILRGKHPNSIANLKPYRKGQSGNPGGKPKVDFARIIARAILEQNDEAAYKALGAALLKGNAYVFKELADRAYGKVKETHELTGADGAPLEVTVKLVKANSK
jgi:hypothetical protein